jgi:hypothetical protein
MAGSEFPEPLRLHRERLKTFCSGGIPANKQQAHSSSKAANVFSDNNFIREAFT